MSGSAQFPLTVKLVVGSQQSGNGIDFSNMSISFRVEKGSLPTPNVCEVKVYNVAPSTIQKVQKEFTNFWLEAGYGGRSAVIFQGQIKQVRDSRENPTDTYMLLYGADNDPALNFAVINQSLAAGYKPQDMLNAVSAVLDPFGVRPPQQLPTLADTQAPRGRAMYGMARDHARTLAESNNYHWSIQDGYELYLPVDPQLAPGQAVSLNQQSGLINMPQQTENGIMVHALINPNFKLGGIVHINNKDIQPPPYSLVTGALNYYPTVDSDGFYKILFLAHVGDTRGEGGTTLLTCTALNGGAPLSSAGLGVQVGV